MEKSGNSYVLTAEEKAFIKKLIDQKFGNETKSTNYRAAGKKRVSEDIKKHTGKEVGDSTLGRLTGIDKGSGSVSVTKLNIVAEYLGLNDAETLIRTIFEAVKGKVDTGDAAPDFINKMFQDHIVRIKFNDEKQIDLEHRAGNLFIVRDRAGFDFIKSGDELHVARMNVNEDFECSDVVRTVDAGDLDGNKKREHHGKFRTGKIISIELMKKVGSDNETKYKA